MKKTDLNFMFGEIITKIIFIDEDRITSIKNNEVHFISSENREWYIKMDSKGNIKVYSFNDYINLYECSIDMSMVEYNEKFFKN